MPSILVITLGVSGGPKVHPAARQGSAPPPSGSRGAQEELNFHGVEGKLNAPIGRAVQ